MANIDITVTKNLYSIALDKYEWTELTVNGQRIQKNSEGGYVYQQETEGQVNFEASAKGLKKVNPGDHFEMCGIDKTHLARLNYFEEGHIFKIHGELTNVPPTRECKPGPFQFSQGKMTGHFRRVP
jgi:hypothetical protein